MCLLGTVNKLTQDAVKSCDVDSPLRAPDTSLVDRTGGGQHWIAYRILSSYLSQQASISLILDSETH